ncbi:MAG: Rieske (2Fe-2S) protein [Candidatus Marinimicrobia bacterium]|nr:Rieske (2Fe-2S) protein [Candidatus Neomarinimicrobiota bacterium]
MSRKTEHYVRAAKLSDVQTIGCKVVHLERHTVALFAYRDKIYALDNRCPHMGFPLHQGTVKNGILTCHWHHARFDLVSGGTFDQWADDVRMFPVQIRDGEVWVDLAQRVNLRDHQRERLRDGLERNIPLIIGKAVIVLLDSDGDPREPFCIGLEFGTRYRQGGWGQGLTIHTCMMNLLPYLDSQDRRRAFYHGLAAISKDCAGMPPRFGVRPLPSPTTDLTTLKAWFRQFVEVRDSEGAERCIVSAVRAGANLQKLADMLFAAATDHRYIDIGHVLDFTNKALEALDAAGLDYAEQVLTSLASSYANADRMEESNAWRNPVDLIKILQDTFEALPKALETGRNRRGTWSGHDKLVSVVLGEDPQAIADKLLTALRAGCTEEELASAVAYAAALRIARFHTSNEFSDWDTALHTFTFANAVHQGLRRVASPELLRGTFDAAMSIYLDRFLNVPAVRLVESDDTVKNPEKLLDELPELLDRQQQINTAGELVGRYLYSGGAPDRLMAMLGRLLLREDRDFHTIQMLEAAFCQYSLLSEMSDRTNVLVAATRYLAAHAQTVRAQGQTYQIALRLHRGVHLYEEF